MRKKTVWLMVMTVVIMSFTSMLHAGYNPVLVLGSVSDQEIWASEGATLIKRIGDRLLLELPSGTLARYGTSSLRYDLLEERGDDSVYYVVTRKSPGTLAAFSAFREGRVLFTAEDFVIIEAAPDIAEGLVGNGYHIQQMFFDAKPWSPPSLSRDDVSVTWSSTIAETIALINPETLYNATAALSGDVPVSIGGESYTIHTRNSYQTEAIQKATEYAFEYFENLGYPVSYHTFNGPGQRNVIAVKDGLLYPELYYVICGHIDDMPSGDLAPGADDNASGSVGVMLAAELLSTFQTDYSVIFALWTGEEQGLHGSYNFARDAYNAGMQILGVINMDMIAWDSKGDPQVELHSYRNAIPESYELAQMMAQVIPLYDLNLTTQILSLGSGASDHASFWQYGYSAIMVIEDFADFNPNYHSRNDLVATLNMPFFTNIVKASVATLLHLVTSSSIPLDGDVDGSGRVDGIDLILLNRAFDTSVGDSSYRAEADFDQSGTIDDADLAVLTAQFGYSLY